MAYDFVRRASCCRRTQPVVPVTPWTTPGNGTAPSGPRRCTHGPLRSLQPCDAYDLPPRTRRARGRSSRFRQLDPRSVTPAATSGFAARAQGPAGAGAPRLRLPVLGNGSFAVDLVAAPNAPTILGIAPATQSLPVGPCTLYLAGPILLLPGVANAHGVSVRRLSVPADPSLHGAAAYAQGFAADGGAFAGVAFTAGLKLTLGE